MSAEKLTTLQIKEIKEKYAAGMTQKALAEEYGVSPMTIQKRIGSHYKGYRKSEIRYKNIENWIYENELSTKKLADKAGLTPVALYYILIGKNNPNKKSIDRILKATGLTYEEAFAE